MMLFRYTEKDNIKNILSEILFDNIKIKGYSNIDNSIIMKTNFSLNDDIQYVLKHRKKDDLKNIIRKSKINKTTNNNYNIKIEFLDFWYRNFDDLFYLEYPRIKNEIN